MADSPPPLVVRAVVAGVRAVARVVPKGLRRRLEDRVFTVVQHVTRVTDDGYPQPSATKRPPGKGTPPGDEPGGAPG